MTLDAYLTDRDLTDLQFAGLVQADRSTISRLRRGKLTPSFDLLQRIAVATDGQVTPNDFLPAVVPTDLPRPARSDTEAVS